jgi:hypothetical protein
VFCRKGFLPPARRERRAYPQWSVRSEPRSGRQKELRPEGLRRKRPGASLLLGHRAPTAMLPRRASHQAILGATKHQPILRHYTHPAPRMSAIRSAPRESLRPRDYATCGKTSLSIPARFSWSIDSCRPR